VSAFLLKKGQNMLNFQFSILKINNFLGVLPLPESRCDQLPPRVFAALSAAQRPSLCCRSYNSIEEGELLCGFESAAVSAAFGMGVVARAAAPVLSYTGHRTGYGASTGVVFVTSRMRLPMPFLAGTSDDTIVTIR